MVAQRRAWRLGLAVLTTSAALAACGGSTSSTRQLTLLVDGDAERAKVQIDVGGGAESLETSLPFRRDVEIEGRFRLELRAESLDGGALRCSVDGLDEARAVPVNPSLGMDEVELGGPLASPADVAVRCEVSGEIDGSSLSYESSVEALGE